MKKVLEIKSRGKPNIFMRRKMESYGFEVENCTTRSTIWKKEVDEKEDKRLIRKYKRYCLRKNMEWLLVDKRYMRGSGYREKYLTHDPGMNGVYFCIYCARPLKREKVTIDHIIPVDRAKRSRIARFILRMRGIEDVNDIRNLGVACKKCNRKKSNKLSLFWMTRAFFGKIPFFWFVRWCIYTMLFILLIKGSVYIMPHLESNIYFLVEMFV